MIHDCTDGVPGPAGNVTWGLCVRKKAFFSDQPVLQVVCSVSCTVYDGCIVKCSI